jgi:Zn-dependent protease with chaperone function
VAGGTNGFHGAGALHLLFTPAVRVCATDEQVAFVVGHEIAHHDLGHVALFRGWADKIVRLPGAALFALFFHGLERLVYGPPSVSYINVGQ